MRDISGHFGSIPQSIFPPMGLFVVGIWMESFGGLE